MLPASKVLDEVLESQSAPPERAGEQGQLVARHVERVVDDEVKRRDQPRDRRAQLVRDFHEELLFEPEEFRLGRDIADRVKGAPAGERRRHQLEDAHPVLAREPRAPHQVTVGLLNARRAGNEKQLLEDVPDERILAEDEERRRVGAHDQAVVIGEDDAVGQRDESFGEGRLIEGGILAPPPSDPTSFRG